MKLDEEDAIVLRALKSTRKMLKGHGPWELDHPHIIHACETLIRWYGKIDEPFE
jgi:hypothetical protein